MEQFDELSAEEGMPNATDSPKVDESHALLNIDLRGSVLSKALLVERTLNTVLVALLKIKVPSARTLGNKSTSISVKNKVDLLYDLELLTKDQTIHFLLFLEVRNQFMHNYDCNSFMKCSEYVDAFKIEKLRKKYPGHTQEDSEKELEEYFNIISYDILGYIKALFDEVITRTNREQAMNTVAKLVPAYKSLHNNLFSIIDSQELQQVALSSLPATASTELQEAIIAATSKIKNHLITRTFSNIIDIMHQLGINMDDIRKADNAS